MRKQRLIGLALVAVAALIVALASTGTTPEERDATAAILIGLLGLYMIFTKEYVLYDGKPIEEGESPRIRESHHEAELDPWAQMSLGAAIGKDTTTPDIKKGAAPWQENVL